MKAKRAKDLLCGEIIYGFMTPTNDVTFMITPIVVLDTTKDMCRVAVGALKEDATTVDIILNDHLQCLISTKDEDSEE